MGVYEELHIHREEIYEIARRNCVKKVRIFGSVARGSESLGSDIDFLVEPAPGASLFDLARFKIQMEALLRKRVDVVSERGLHPLIKTRILKDARPV